MRSITWTSLHSMGAFGFVFFGMALSGVPGWSRLVYLFSAILVLLTMSAVLAGHARPGRWLLVPLTFVAIASVGALARFPQATDEMIRLLGIWSGSLLVADAVRRGVHTKFVIVAMLLASAANSMATVIGFDAYAEYQASAQQLYYGSVDARRSGMVGNANLFALQAVLTLFAVLVWREGIPRLLVALGVLCAIHAVIVSGSRNALVLISLFAFASWVRSSPGRRKLLFASIPVLVVLTLVWLDGRGISGIESFAVQVGAIDRIIESVEGRDSSLYLRAWMFEVAMNMFFNAPFLGHGLGYFADQGGFGGYAHSNYLEILVSGGALLFSCYYLIHVIVLVRLVPLAIKGGAACAAGCVTVIGLLMVDLGLVGYDRVVVVLILALLFMMAFQKGPAGVEEARGGMRDRRAEDRV